MKNVYKKILLILLIISALGFVQRDSDIYFQMSKGIDIFGRVYKEVSLNYVDDIKPTGLLKREFNIK
jgi:carboxyl-terminal processing protease